MNFEPKKRDRQRRNRFVHLCSDFISVPGFFRDDARWSDGSSSPPVCGSFFTRKHRSGRVAIPSHNVCIWWLEALVGGRENTHSEEALMRSFCEFENK